MSYAVLLGSNCFVGTSGILSVTANDKATEFFRIREIDRARSSGSYLAIDCDIRDAEGKREIKLFKNRPVAESPDVKVLNPGGSVEVYRADGTLVIKAEVLDRDAINLDGLWAPIRDRVVAELEKIEEVLSLTGEFQAGPYRVSATPSELRFGLSGIATDKQYMFKRNFVFGGGGINLSEKGIGI